MSGRVLNSWLCETCIPDAQLLQETKTGNEMTTWTSQCERYMLWIDGVGAWQLCIGNSFLVGGPTLEHPSADVCLMANISRRHATILRQAEDWFIQPHAPVVVSGKTIGERGLLKTGDEIRLGERVRLGFRVPNVLSGSAILDFESPHRPAQSVNGIILMTDNCLLGPRRDHHICCPEWPELMVLFWQDGKLRCRSKMAFRVNENRVRETSELQDGDIVSGEGFRFRIERLKK